MEQQERQREIETGRRRFKNTGEEEAYRRGYIDIKGEQR
jgi:hypothetical protein